MSKFDETTDVDALRMLRKLVHVPLERDPSATPG